MIFTDNDDSWENVIADHPINNVRHFFILGFKRKKILSVMNFVLLQMKVFQTICFQSCSLGNLIA